MFFLAAGFATKVVKANVNLLVVLQEKYFTDVYPAFSKRNRPEQNHVISAVQGNNSGCSRIAVRYV